MPVIMGERCSSVGAIDPKFEIGGDIGLAYGTSLVDDDGTRVRVICGDFWGRRGPVEELPGSTKRRRSR